MELANSTYVGTVPERGLGSDKPENLLAGLARLDVNEVGEKGISGVFRLLP